MGMNDNNPWEPETVIIGQLFHNQTLKTLDGYNKTNMVHSPKISWNCYNMTPMSEPLVGTWNCYNGTPRSEPPMGTWNYSYLRNTVQNAEQDTPFLEILSEFIFSQISFDFFPITEY